MAIERLRGRALQVQRHRVWLLDPCCAVCRRLCRFPSGFELDHKVALTNGGTNDDENMQVLCHEDHESKTNADLGYQPKPTIGADGWPVEATPEQSRTARWKRAGRG
ncbi:HNH endonuclease signature motif containing protein [Massilia sp. DWR3-1-1]|uniref:HNH endonuclease signature motif containing protein n=1 Tax=Massilia sp. DWR3-1-1 TaxID=2804559 RepID=UPI003CEEDC27